MSATKAKRVGPSLHWMFVPYQKCCIEVEQTASTWLPTPAGHSNTSKVCIYLQEEKLVYRLGRVFSSSVTVNSMHK